MIKISVFTFLIYLIIQSCKSESECIPKYPDAVIRYNLNSIYKQAVVDYYLINLELIYFKKKINNKEVNIDSSKSLLISSCNIVFDSLILNQNYVTFYFGFSNDGVNIIRSDWYGEGYHTLGIKYDLNSSTVVESLGIGFEKKFNLSNKIDLFDKDKINFFNRNMKILNKTLICLLKERYSNCYKVSPLGASISDSVACAYKGN